MKIPRIIGTWWSISVALLIAIAYMLLAISEMNIVYALLAFLFAFIALREYDLLRDRRERDVALLRLQRTFRRD